MLDVRGRVVRNFPNSPEAVKLFERPLTRLVKASQASTLTPRGSEGVNDPPVVPPFPRGDLAGVSSLFRSGGHRGFALNAISSNLSSSSGNRAFIRLHICCKRESVRSQSDSP